MVTINRFGPSVNSGYVGWSMSQRAADAYEDGEMPKSKWTKAAMIAAIKDFCAETQEDSYHPVTYDKSIEKLKKDEIFKCFFELKSWHHTSKYFNETDFYGVNEDAVREAMQNPKAYRNMRIKERLFRENPAEKYYRECRKAAQEELRRFKIAKHRIISPLEFFVRYGKDNGAAINFDPCSTVDGFSVLFDRELYRNPDTHQWGLCLHFDRPYDIEHKGLKPSIDLDEFKELRENPELVAHPDLLNQKIEAAKSYLVDCLTLKDRCCDVIWNMRSTAQRAVNHYLYPTVYQFAEKFPWAVTHRGVSEKGHETIGIVIPAECCKDGRECKWNGRVVDAKEPRQTPYFLRDGRVDMQKCAEISAQMETHDIDEIGLSAPDAMRDRRPNPSDIASAARAEAAKMSHGAGNRARSLGR